MWHEPFQGEARQEAGEEMTVFFDLDKTLMDVNSGSQWLRYEFNAGRVTVWQAIRAFLWLLLYHLFGTDMRRPLRQAMAVLTGVPEEEIIERSDAFYAARMAGRVRPGAWGVLEEHRKAGADLILLTSSTVYVARRASAEMGLDGYLGTQLAVGPNGCLLGAAQEPICFGSGKVEIAQRYLDDHGGGSLADAVFYSDSCSDLPMLEAVGRPVTVNPDPKLRRVARKRGWEIQDWGELPT